MWSTTEEIEANLSSGDADRVAEGLASLAFHHETLEPVTVRAPTAEDLACFGDVLPDEVVGHLVALLGSYPHFDPPLDPAQAAEALARMAVRFGPSGLALEASLAVKACEAPGAVTRAALAAVAADDAVRVAEHAGHYLSYLLAGEPEVRAAVVASLAGWSSNPGLRAVRERVASELDDDERGRVMG